MISFFVPILRIVSVVFNARLVENWAPLNVMVELELSTMRVVDEGRVETTANR